MEVKDEFIRKARVTNVVDGDTIDGFVALGYRVWIEARFRLLGVNTPEKGKLGAAEATQYVKDRILNKDVHIQSQKGDSFGRWLATVYFEGSTINFELIDKGYAVPFTK